MIDYEHHTFSGGEEHIKVNAATNAFVHRVESSTDLIKLGLIKEALTADALVSINIPYFPYGRQDRVCNEGEPHSLRFVCNYLKSLGFYKIFTHDLHSPVAHGILPNLINITRASVFKELKAKYDLWVKEQPTLDGELREAPEYLDGSQYDALIAPDAGALKHCYDDAEALGIDKVFTATKVSDLKTREIIETTVEADPQELQGMRVIITDDICDGGRTFLELAKVLKDFFGVEQVDLFVTHGIFMNGLGQLSQYIDHIYTTDSRTNSSDMKGKFHSIMDGEEPQDFLTVLEIIGNDNEKGET